MCSGPKAFTGPLTGQRHHHGGRRNGRGGRVQPDGNYFLPVTIISQDSNEAHIVPQELSNILSVGSVVLVF